MRLCNLIAAVFLVSFAASSLWAQNAVSTGALSGQIRDASHAVVPNVQVSAVNIATRVKYSATTNADGLYSFPALPIGLYNVTFSQDNFQTSAVQNVEASVGRTTTVSLELQVGSVSQQVTVEAAGEMLHPTDSSTSAVIGQQLIADLPLNGRRYTDFVLLTPNVTADGQFGLVSIAGQQGGADSGYANGNGSNSFTVDGANATSAYFGEARGRTRVPYVFGEQSIQEFQVADIHDRSLSRENVLLPTRATEERANTITAEFSARDLCLSARALAFRRTRHPFAVSSHLCGLHRRLSLCPLPVSKQFGGSLGSLRSVAQSATCKTWQAAY